MHAPSAKIKTSILLILLLCCGAWIMLAGPRITPSLRKEAPSATLDSKIMLRENLERILIADGGKSTRLTKISYSDPETGDITIIWRLNEEPSRAAKISAAQTDAVNILKALADSRSRFIYVILIGTFPTQDTPAEMQVIDLGFNQSKLEKVDWETFRPTDVYTLADVAVIADAWK